MFTDKEVEYLDSQRLGRLATVTTKNQAHVVPTGFRVSDDRTAIEVGGHNLSARRPLYLRNIETNRGWRTSSTTSHRPTRGPRAG